MTLSQRQSAYNFTQRAIYEDWVRTTGEQPTNETYMPREAFWVGFSYMSGTQFETNEESKSVMRSRITPDINRSWGPGWYQGKEFMHSKNYTGQSEDRFEFISFFFYLKSIQCGKVSDV